MAAQRSAHILFYSRSGVYIILFATPLKIHLKELPVKCVVKLRHIHVFQGLCMAILAFFLLKIADFSSLLKFKEIGKF